MRKGIFLLTAVCLTIGCREMPDVVPPVQRDTTQPVPYNQSISPEGGQQIEVRVPPEKKRDESGCDVTDGIHAATVDYYNPRTAHTTQYELKVHVEHCQLIRIDFPNGGWLDEDHIPRTHIGKTKDAYFKDDKGRQWKVHLKETPDSLPSEP